MLRQEPQNDETSLSLSFKEYQELKQIIFDEYIKPLCNSINSTESFLNDAEKKNNHEKWFFLSLLFRVKKATRSDIIFGFKVDSPTESLTKNFDKYYKEDEFNDCKKLLLSVAEIYYDESIQKARFPGYDTAVIQTCIRELLHEYINPSPELALESVKSVVADYRKIVDNKYPVVNHSSPYNISYEIGNEIFSYLNYQSSNALASTCKFFHLSHNMLKFRSASIFYALGDPVIITRNRKWNEPAAISTDSLLLTSKEVNEKVVGNSINSNKVDTITLFPSLYQAIEYAHHLKNDPNDHVFPDARAQPLTIPSVWAVTYQEHRANLDFNSKAMILRRGWSSNYADSERNLAIFCASVEKNSICPILGTVLYSSSCFAKYKQFAVVNYHDYLKQQEQVKREESRCSIM